MARYIGSSPTITLGSGFTTGNQTRDSMYDFLKAMGGVTGSAPGIFSLNEIHAQLKASNSIIILKDKILFKKPSNFSKPIAKILNGRVLIVRKCEKDWCKIETGKYKGWIKTDNIWGSIIQN